MGKKVTESSGTRHCYGCGKEFYVQWPLMWTYARTEGPRRKYFCSWSCMRKYDKEKGEPKVGGRRKITKDQEKEAVRIALDGGDPLTFLKECGIENPSQKWYDIKNEVKETDPDTFAKLPLRIQRKKEPETPEKPLPVQDLKLHVQDLKLQPGGNYRISVETPEAPKIYKPVVYDGMTVREVEGGFGRYRRSDTKDSIYIDFEYADGVDVVSLTVDQWRTFREEQLKAAMILGVAL